MVVGGGGSITGHEDSLDRMIFTKEAVGWHLA
jgi:hypothetical protein